MVDFRGIFRGFSGIFGDFRVSGDLCVLYFTNVGITVICDTNLQI